MAIMDMCRALRLRRKEDAVESADINERLGIQFKGPHSLQDCARTMPNAPPTKKPLSQRPSSVEVLAADSGRWRASCLAMSLMPLQ